MKSILTTFLITILCILSFTGCSDSYEIQTSKDDIFYLNPKKEWKVELEKEIPFQYSRYSIKPKKGSAFSLKLLFKTDTPDIANFNSIDKIKEAVLKASVKAKTNMVEDEINLNEIKEKGTYGYYAIFTDKRLVNIPKPEPGQYLYLTGGMVRLSKDTVLSFSLVTNEIHSQLYQELFDYIYNFIKINE